MAAAEAGRTVAGYRPNPSIVAETENIAGSGQYRGLRSAETTAGLALPIELGGKRSARIAVAEAIGNRARIGTALAEADLIPTAKMLMDKMQKRGATIPIAVDVVVGFGGYASAPAYVAARRALAAEAHLLAVRELAKGVLQRAPRHPQADPLLRVHRHCLAR